MSGLFEQSSIPFYKLSPGGNTTLLVPAAAVPADRRAAVAAELMDSLHLGAEQVGFIDPDAAMPSIAMMGGEFCGNACRCLAALVVMLADDAPQTWPVRGELRSSGAAAPVAWRVRPCAGETGGMDAAVCVDLTGAVISGLAPGLTRVDMPGIVHLLLDENLHPQPVDPAAEAAAWRARLNLDKHAAVGCIRHAPLIAGEQYIAPLVWVRDTNSSCPETACGSGSLALALAVHSANGKVKMDVRQPSGEYISVELETETGLVPRAWIGGPVRLIARGKAYLK